MDAARERRAEEVAGRAVGCGGGEAEAVSEAVKVDLRSDLCEDVAAAVRGDGGVGFEQ